MERQNHWQNSQARPTVPKTEQLDFGRALAGLDGLGAHECGTEIHQG
jgi:hypothetical protein